MENPKKHSIAKKRDAVQESETIYGIENNSILNGAEKLDPVLEILLLQSIQDAKDEKGISHEEMMRRVKLRYPFLK